MSELEAGRFDAERAAHYDDHIRRVSPGYEVLHDHIADLLTGTLGPSAHILVVGAGTGAEVERLGRAAPGWTFTAVDPSADMLAVCADRADRAGLGERVRCLEGTVETVDAAGPFDAATSICVAHFALESDVRAGYFQAIAERLRPGAPFVQADLFRPASDAAFERLWAAWQRALDRAGVPEDEADAFFGRVEQQVHLADEETLARETAAAGFGPCVRFHQALLWGGWIAERLAGEAVAG
ncbi:MAG: class I SAM-dependent methyltransferase [Bacteroidota bacterium]